MSDIYFPEIKTGASIHEAFALGGGAGAENVREGTYPARINPDQAVISERFHSRIPIAVLTLHKVEENLFFGLISISPLYPTFFPEKLSNTIYADQADRLIGFNESFYRFFAEQYPVPGDMLDKPLSLFMTPTPQEIQNRFLAQDNKGGGGDFKTLFCETGFSEGSAKGPEVIIGPGILQIGADGSTFVNDSGPNAYLLIPIPGKSGPQDLRIELCVRGWEGDAPLLVIGFGALRDPENQSYLSCGHGQVELSVIKKTGFQLVSGDAPVMRQGETCLSLHVTGRSVVFEQDGNPLCAYFDPHAFPGRPLFAGIGLRKGSAAAIRCLRILTKPGGPRPETLSPGCMLVSLKTKPARYLLLNRFYNFGLSSAGEHVRTAGYFLQDITPFQKDITALTNRCRHQSEESLALRTLLQEQKGAAQVFIGSSAATMAVKAKADLIAPSEATVLIQGDTGTGKEVLANYIHQQSRFARGPFIKVDCASLPNELLESELFGHEKGAFTGAAGRKIGKFEQADNGTIFLDEVGNFTPAIQAKLLQFLQDFTVVRVGGRSPIRLKVRLIAASNVVLADLVKRGLFREDLYYRLCVMVITLPPLHARKDDLLELAGHYIRVFSAGSGNAWPVLSAEAYRKLHAHHWPGNIRELRNVIQRAVIFCKGAEISAEHIVLNEETGGEGNARPVNDRQSMRPRVLMDYSAGAIVDLVRKHGGRVSRAAGELGLTPRAIYYFLKRRKIDIRSI